MAHSLRSGSIDFAACRQRACERDLIHQRIAHQGRPDIAQSLHHIIQPSWQTGLMQNFRHLQGAKRRCFRGFKDHCIATGQSWRGLPSGNLRGVIPSANANANPERLPDRIDKILTKLHMLPGEAPGQATKIFQSICRRGGIGHQSFLQGFAGVIGFQFRQ